MKRITALLACSVLLVACSGPDPVTPTKTSGAPSPSTSASADATASPTPGTDKALPKIKQDAKVTTFERPKSCENLLEVLKKRGESEVTAYGLPDNVLTYDAASGGRGIIGDYSSGDGSIPGAAPGETNAKQAEGDHSVTNTQEEAVGEFADTVTNGKVIASIVWSEPRYTHPVGSEVHLINPENLEDFGVIDVGSDAVNGDNHLAFVDDNTLLVLSSFYNESGSRTRIMRVDVSDPTKAKVTSTVRMNGAYQAARLINGKVIVASTASPHGLNFTQPKDKSVRGEREALDVNKKIIADSKLEQWMADAEILDGDNKPVQEELTFTDCEQVLLGNDRSFQFTTVASIDPSNPIMTVHKGSAVMGNVNGVYASTDRVVTWVYGEELDGFDDAQLVSFNITNPEAIKLGGTGAVKGTIPGSWGVDEENGIIRISSTTYARNANSKEESRVTVLQEQGENLVPVGMLNGLGQDEEIKSIRWLTPELGVLVTFRETDPVYTIDTTDPTNPKKAGELKIPGYSAYLHPVAKDRILGIGQHADPTNGQPMGFKYSLFDISDLNAPKELDTREFTGTKSKAEYDHQAFTWHKDRGYVAISDNLSNDGHDGSDDLLTVSGVAIEDDKIKVLGNGELKTKNAFAGANTVVIGNALYAANPSSIGKFDATTIKDEKQRFLP